MLAVGAIRDAGYLPQQRQRRLEQIEPLQLCGQCPGAGEHVAVKTRIDRTRYVGFEVVHEKSFRRTYPEAIKATQIHTG
jgi:hypothetical protein